MTVDVCYVISHGFSARMILHSGIIPHLRRRGLTVAVVSPDAGEPSMEALAARLDISTEPTPAAAGKLEGFVLQKTLQYCSEDIEGNPALWAKYLRERATGSRSSRLTAPLLLALNQATLHAPMVPAGITRLQQRLLRNPAIAAALGRLAPRLVVSTYPVNHVEASFLFEAKRAGIATAIQLLSWDNITCKGRFPATADDYLSWGPIMSAELGAHYGVAPDRIRACGVPHFDEHLAPGTRAAREGVVRALGLDPARPYLFFGMSSPYFAPHEIDVVEWIAAQVVAGRFGDAVQLVVRPHPQNVQGSMADKAWLPRLDALRGPRVAVDYPSLQPSKLAWNMKEADLPHLASLLAGCAVCINSGSTLSIDAIIHDKPVILSTFDAGHTLPWWQSARRVEAYPHLRKLIALGGVRVTGSFAALGEAIDAYLAQPALDAAGRATTRAQECSECDGRASERAATALAELVAGRA